jgi:hypothetical protein
VACDNNGGPDGVSSLVSFPVRANSRYLVGVDGVLGAQGSIVLRWRLCLAPSPFEVTAGNFTLRSPVNAQPYPDQPLYQWFQGEQSLGSTASPALILDAVPPTAAFFSVRYATAQQGVIKQVTNQLGWVVTMVPNPAAPAGSQQFLLPGLTSTHLAVEAANQSRTNCDGRWLWERINNFEVSAQANSVVITLPDDPENPTRIHRIRPASPPPP